MQHTEPPHKPLRYRHVQALVCNLDHPKASVRIASLRAATRLAGLEDVVSPDVRENMLSQVERRLGSYRSEDILGVSYLPEPNVREEIGGGKHSRNSCRVDCCRRTSLRASSDRRG